MKITLECLEGRALLYNDGHSTEDGVQEQSSLPGICQLFTPSNNAFWIDVSVDLVAGTLGGMLAGPYFQKENGRPIGGVTGAMFSASLLLITTPVGALDLCSEIAEQTSDLINTASRGATYAMAAATMFAVLAKFSPNLNEQEANG